MILVNEIISINGGAHVPPSKTNYVTKSSSYVNQELIKKTKLNTAVYRVTKK